MQSPSYPNGTGAPGRLLRNIDPTLAAIMVRGAVLVDVDILREELNIDSSIAVSDYFDNMTAERVEKFKSSKFGTATGWILPISRYATVSEGEIGRQGLNSFASFVAKSRSTESPLCSDLADIIYWDVAYASSELVAKGTAGYEDHPFDNSTMRMNVNTIADTGDANVHYLPPPTTSPYHSIVGPLPTNFHSYADINFLLKLREATSQNPAKATKVHWHCLPPTIESGSCHTLENFDWPRLLAPNSLAPESEITCHLPSGSEKCQRMEDALKKHEKGVKSLLDRCRRGQTFEIVLD